MPPLYQPMLAATGSRLRALDRADWRFEPKLDGWCALAYLDGNLTIRTRAGRDITHTLPELQALPSKLVRRAVVLDGELVAGSGIASDFYRLGPRLARREQTAPHGCPVTFVAFDVLWLDDASTCQLPYRRRRKLLKSLHVAGGCWQTAPSFDGDPLDVLVACDKLDIEGVVAKRLDSVYQPGKRSAHWIKVKTPAWRERHAARRTSH